MESPIHSIYKLFDQLGLDSSKPAIENFIDEHYPIPNNQLLYEANFWTPSQASFLKESLQDDADWSEVVDYLDALLRE